MPAAASALRFYARWLIFAGLRYQTMLSYAFATPQLIAPHSDGRERAPLLIVAWLALGMIHPLIPLTGSPLILSAINRWIVRSQRSGAVEGAP